MLEKEISFILLFKTTNDQAIARIVEVLNKREYLYKQLRDVLKKVHYLFKHWVIIPTRTECVLKANNEPLSY